MDCDIKTHTYIHTYSWDITLNIESGWWWRNCDNSTLCCCFCEILLQNESEIIFACLSAAIWSVFQSALIVENITTTETIHMMYVCCNKLNRLFAFSAEVYVTKTNKNYTYPQEETMTKKI